MLPIRQLVLIPQRVTLPQGLVGPFLAPAMVSVVPSDSAVAEHIPRVSKGLPRTIPGFDQEKKSICLMETGCPWHALGRMLGLLLSRKGCGTVLSCTVAGC